MNYTKAKCGHPVIAVGMPGSDARIECETDFCDQCKCVIIDAMEFAESIPNYTCLTNPACLAETWMHFKRLVSVLSEIDLKATIST